MGNLKNKKGYKKNEFATDIKWATSLDKTKSSIYYPLFDKQTMVIDISKGVHPICKKYYERRQRISDYEAYDAMHNADGIVGKSLSPSKL